MTVGCGAAAMILCIGWVVLFYKSKGLYGDIIALQMEGIRLQKLAPAMLHALNLCAFTRRFPLATLRLGRLIGRLHGDQSSGKLVLLFLAELCSYSYLLIAGGLLLSALPGGDAAGVVIGGLLSFLLPAALIADLRAKVRRREQEIILELPELLNKIMLLVGAGETVQQAFKHCFNRRREAGHPLYKELGVMLAEYESGYSFGQTLEGFARRCGVQEAASFASAVMLNFRRGGNDFTLALRDLSHSLWEKRKAVSRTRGEQASSKLLLPMLLLFIVVLMLVGTPAFMMMDF